MKHNNLHSYSPLAIARVTFLALLPLLHHASADDCQPWTWTWDAARKVDAAAAPSRAAVKPYVRAATVNPGDINCRSWAQTYDNVGYWSCSQLADDFGITLDKFWMLNPTLAPDCEGIQPNTEYCVDGFIEPLRSTDGFCGPDHKNATCIGSDFGQCCNAATWKCGQTEDDCSPGICWEGQCPGHTIYTTDGNCGYAYGFALCAGKWGDCCSLDGGKCGTGDAFCGPGNCQSGNCTTTTTTTTTSSGASTSAQTNGTGGATAATRVVQ
ncbi:hypothetical protein B0J18DRAFT_180146 [Chaetomium sp. MPI-SDFR-AT-0129]|nr:hypothetical protein B0J18DRAFT_180146 [Chaetomium sp. MPI-SDFR-AT-0129]